MNLTEEMLRTAQERYGYTHPISLYNGEIYTAQDYRILTKEFSKMCEIYNLKKNSTAMLLFDDCPAAIVAFLGCIRYGLVPVLISKKTSHLSLKEMLRTADPSVLITDDGICVEAFFDERTCICVATDERKELRLEIIAKGNGQYQFIDAQAIAYLSSSSGSSGLPKLVMHNHKEMLFASENYAVQSLKLDSRDILYSVPKMYFTYGLANNLFFPFLSGAPAILCNKGFSPENCVQNLLKYRPTCFFAVPSVYTAMYTYLKNRNDLAGLFSSCRLFVSAGEALSAELSSLWKELTGKYIADSAGCSETGSAFLVNLAGADKCGSAGSAVAGYHLHLWKDSSAEDPNTGVLCIKSESNAMGYFNNPAETQAKFLNGWIKTGDVFRVDQDGYYWFVGRTDSLFKYNGMWISPEQIEQVVCGFPGIKECVLHKVKRSVHSKLAVTLCVSTEFAGIPSLKEYLKERLDGYKCPKVFRIVDQIPMNLNGKRDYRKMQQNAERIIVTIDGPSKMGKSTLAELIAAKYGIKHINAGVFFRFLKWCCQKGILSESDLDDEECLASQIAQLTLSGEEIRYMGKEISQELHGHMMAMETAKIAGKAAIQSSVLRHIKQITLEDSIVVEGRNMGADIFPEADLKLFLSGSPEKRVHQWCIKNGYDEHTYQFGVADMKRRNYLDETRQINPLRKAEDALEICADDKEPAELLCEVSTYIDQLL